MSRDHVYVLLINSRAWLSHLLKYENNECYDIYVLGTPPEYLSDAVRGQVVLALGDF